MSTRWVVVIFAAAAMSALVHAQQPLTRIRRRDAACRAGEKPHVQAGFELADGLAQRRLRHAEFGRRLGEASLPPHGRKGHQIVETVAAHLSVLLIGPFRL